MSNLTCYDANGELLKTLFQWDHNQTITVTGLTVPPVPVFHFCNRKSDTALVVTPSVGVDGITAHIPNILLTEAEPITVFLYAYNTEDGYRTIHAINIPVVPRPQPDDWVFEDNVEYLSASLLNTRLSTLIGSMSDSSSGSGLAELVDIRVGYNGNQYATAGDAVRALGAQIDDIEETLMGYVDQKIVDGFLYEDDYLYLTSKGTVVSEGVKIVSGSGGGGGGGGGDVNGAEIKATNATGWLSKTISSGSDCELSVSWYSVEDGTPTGDGVLRILVGGALKTTMQVHQGLVTFNVKDYLSAGDNTVRCQFMDIYGNTTSVIFTITVMALSINSTFDPYTVYTGAITFPYTPTGRVSKTVYFYIDDILSGTFVTTTSNSQLTYSIPAQSHGSHTLRVYFEADVAGELVRSNELFYDIICTVQGNTDTIITSAFNTTTATQYTTLVIPYRVYHPVNLTSPVQISVNGVDVYQTPITVDRTEQTFSYRAENAGDFEIIISSGGTEKEFDITITEADINVSAETNDLVLYLTAHGRSNQETTTRETWEYGNIEATMTGFNFVSNGWVQDRDGVIVLRVSGDARVVIPYKIFAQDFRTTGKTIELEFATRDVLNYDSTIISCWNGNRGITVSAQKATLKSEQSEIFTQYKEDEHVRIAFVVEKRAENRLVIIYINGIASGVVQYPDNDNFAQAIPVNISIGSNDCVTDIYCIRVYDNDLTRAQIVNNWIADTQVGSLMMERYNHNNVYDEYGSVVIAKLPPDLPYLILTGPELPPEKGKKRTMSGSYTDPVHTSKSFTFSNAQVDVQGTSSQFYPRKNYKIKFKGGFTLANGTTASTYAINAQAVPTSTFTFKADVASSEGANNVELARLYNDACPYQTPGQELDPKVRQGIDGFPIVVFWNNGSETVFLGKYNFNNDKGTPEVFGFVDGDESWEILNNTGNRVIWKSNDYDTSAWLNDFEARYPDTDPPYENPAQLKEFATWVKSTDTTAASGSALSTPVTYPVTRTTYVEVTDPDTGAITIEELITTENVTFTTDTAEYRLAKFKAEAGNYMEMQSALFYYLFTELFLMVDSRAKNAFPSFMGTEVNAGE